MSKLNSLSLLASAAFAVMPVAAAATAPAPASDTTITVTGERLKRSEARKRSHDFVSLTTATRFNQFGRRTTPICPRTIGIDPAFAAVVEARIRSIAESVRISQFRANCSPNLFILFTSDGDGLMAMLRKARPALFSNVLPSEQKRLFSSAQPIRWWHGNQVVNSEGTTIVSGTDGQGIVSSVSNSTSSSQLDTKIKISLTDSVVVVDVSKSAGYPLEAIADYTALVSLAQIRGDRDFDGLPSILSLFSKGPDAAQAQKELTLFDKAYLNSLYRILLNRERFLQKGQIVGRMATQLSYEDR